jgi:hypothetical protein
METIMSMLAMARSGFSYLTSHPMFLFDAAKNAARLNVAIPLDLLRWAIDRRPRGKGPERIALNADPPGLGLELTVDLYGTKIDVSSRIQIEKVENLEDAFKIALRVSDLQVKAPPGSPAAQMIGMLDLKNPGSLMTMMPQKHAALVEASGDRFVLDLLGVPALGKNRALRRVLAGLGDTLSIKRISTDGDNLLIGFRVDPLALPSSIARLRAS